jgi:hypothetical protein
MVLMMGNLSDWSNITPEEHRRTTPGLIYLDAD